jgi:hypothetical protein
MRTSKATYHNLHVTANVYHSYSNANTRLKYRIWSSHRDDYEKYYLLKCDAVCSGKSLPAFQGKAFLQFSRLKSTPKKQTALLVAYFLLVDCLTLRPWRWKLRNFIKILSDKMLSHSRIQYFSNIIYIGTKRVNSRKMIEAWEDPEVDGKNIFFNFRI